MKFLAYLAIIIPTIIMLGGIFCAVVTEEGLVNAAKMSVIIVLMLSVIIALCYCIAWGITTLENMSRR